MEDIDIARVSNFYNAFTGKKSKDMRRSAAALAQLLNTDQTPERFRAYYQALRLWPNHSTYSKWSAVSLPKIKEMLSDERYFFTVIALGIFHYNGYFREQCMDHLIPFGGKALPYLMILANDWVERLRIKAYVACMAILPNSSIEEVIAAISGWTTIQHAERGAVERKAAIKLQLQTRLFIVGTTLNAEKILRFRRIERRFCYEALAKEIYLKSSCLRILLLKEPDQSSRLMVAKAIVASPTLFAELSELLYSNKVCCIRLLLLQRMVAKGSYDHDRLHSALFDTNRRVRQYASFVMQKSGIQNIAEIYRQSLTEHPSHTAIYGLSETGVKDDAVLIDPLLQDSSPIIRKAALQAIIRLRGKQCKSLLYDSLFASWSGEIALKAILKMHLIFPGERIFSDYMKSNDTNVRERLIRLLKMTERWEQLQILLNMGKDVREHLTDWRPGLGKPTEDQVIICQQILLNADIPATLRYELEWFLRRLKV